MSYFRGPYPRDNYGPGPGGNYGGGYDGNWRGGFPPYGGGNGGHRNHGGQKTYRGQYPAPQYKSPRGHPDGYGGQPNGYRGPPHKKVNHYVGQDKKYHWHNNSNPAHREKHHHGHNAHRSPQYGHFDDLLNVAGSEQRELKHWVSKLEGFQRSFHNKVSEAKRLRAQGMDSQAKKYLADADHEWKRWEKRFRGL